MDEYRVETVDRSTFRVLRYGDDGCATVHVTQSHLEARRMRGELERAEARAFKAGLIVGHAEALARPSPRSQGRQGS